MHANGNQGNAFNDRTPNVLASGSSPLGYRDIPNTVEKSNMYSRRDCGMQAREAASADNRSAADGERQNTETFRSPSPTSLEMHTIPQEHERAPTDAAPHSTTDLNPVNARGIVPRCFAQAKEILRFGFVDDSTGKAILKALNITGAQNAKVSTKLKIIAMKMTQRQFSLQDAIAFLDREEEDAIEPDPERDPHFLQSLLPSAVKIQKDRTGDIIRWIRGDAPVFDGDEIKVNEPATDRTVNTPSREPDFEVSEYCRLLHTLGDARVTSTRSQLMEPKTRDELDREPVDPWTDAMAPLFNDVFFRPHPISSLAGGVTREDIASIDLSNRVHERPAGVLKRKFGEFTSMYGTSLAKYELSGQGYPDSFVHFSNAKSHIMYAFCFLKANHLLQPLATRTLAGDVQREEGVGGGVAPDGEIRYGSARKRKREMQEVSIVGMESLSFVLRPFSDEVARATEEAERDKVVYEAADAKARST